MAKKQTIEVNGIKFSADEVESAVIKRNGRRIIIEKEEEEESSGMGFNTSGKDKDKN